MCVLSSRIMLGCQYNHSYLHLLLQHNSPQGQKWFYFNVPGFVKIQSRKFHLLRQDRTIETECRNTKRPHTILLLPSLSMQADPCFCSWFIEGLSWSTAPTSPAPWGKFLFLVNTSLLPSLSITTFLSTTACNPWKFRLHGQAQFVSSGRLCLLSLAMAFSIHFS